MFICKKCGETWEDDEVPTEIEDFGYHTEVGYYPAKQEFIGDCCVCGGEIVEAKKCEFCENYLPEDEKENICEDCLEENMILDNAFRVGEETRESIEINSYLLEEFSKDQIESILYNRLKETQELGLPLSFKNYLKKHKDELEEILVYGGENE